MKHLPQIILLFIFLILGSCTSYDQFQQIMEESSIPSVVLTASFEETWLATLKVVEQYPIEITNKEAGSINTDWIDNTYEINFTEAFNSTTIKSSRFKLIINVHKGYSPDSKMTKVGIYKRQFIEQDFLQGWKEIPSDRILEKTLIHRLKRIIAIDRMLKEIHKKYKRSKSKD